MRQEREHAVRMAFISWAARQSPRPGLVLPEVSTAGKKIDLVCVEEPVDAGTLPAKLKTYLLKVWLRPDTHYNRPDWVRRLGIDQPYMRFVAECLAGKRVWVVELKEHLSSEALGQVLVYQHHFSRTYPELPVVRSLVACLRSDPVVEEVCRYTGIETVVLDADGPTLT